MRKTRFNSSLLVTPNIVIGLISIIFIMTVTQMLFETGPMKNSQVSALGMILGSSTRWSIRPESFKMMIVYLIPLYFIGIASAGFTELKDIHLMLRFNNFKAVRCAVMEKLTLVITAYAIAYALIMLLLYGIGKQQPISPALEQLLDINREVNFDMVFYWTIAVFVLQHIFNVLIFLALSEHLKEIVVFSGFIILNVISDFVPFGDIITPTKGFLNTMIMMENKTQQPYLITISIIIAIFIVYIRRGIHGKRN